MYMYIRTMPKYIIKILRVPGATRISIPKIARARLGIDADKFMIIEDTGADYLILRRFRLDEEITGPVQDITPGQS